MDAFACDVLPHAFKGSVELVNFCERKVRQIADDVKALLEDEQLVGLPTVHDVFVLIDSIEDQRDFFIENLFQASRVVLVDFPNVSFHLVRRQLANQLRYAMLDSSSNLRHEQVNFLRLNHETELVEQIARLQSQALGIEHHQIDVVIDELDLRLADVDLRLVHGVLEVKQAKRVFLLDCLCGKLQWN